MAQTVREILEERLEREMAQHKQANAIAGVLLKNNGKKYTKRMNPALVEAAGEEVWFSDSYGLQTLTTPTYHRTGGNEGVRLFIGRGSGTPVIDYEYIIEHNLGYFKAAADRIDRRNELLSSDEPEIIQKKIDKVNELRKELEGLIGSLPDSTAVNKLVSERIWG